jgi:RIO kinase 2
MRLDATALRYLNDDDFRVLTAVEMGMRNHDLVPVALIAAISGLKHGGTAKSLKEAHKHKLVHREAKRYVGYRLTSLGYDFLALRALVKRGVLAAVGRPLGVGKEADVVLATPSQDLLDEHPEFADDLCGVAAGADGDANIAATLAASAAGEDPAEDEAAPLVAMKLHRLGRTSFRKVKDKRDYMGHRKSASWIYLSRLAAIKEYAFMCALHERGFPVPRPLGQSRHVVVMQLVDGVPLNQIGELGDAPKVATAIVNVIVRLARHGLVHCDLNEFNIMIGEDERVTVIDFPQMVSTRHPEAQMFYERDLDGVVRFFLHRFAMDSQLVDVVSFEDAVADSLEVEEERIDMLLAASGFGNSDVTAGIDLETLALPTEEEEEGGGNEGGKGDDAEHEDGEADSEHEDGESDAEGDNCGSAARNGRAAGVSDFSYDDIVDKDNVDGGGVGCEDDETSSQYSVGASEYSVGGTRINRAKIAERVRQQRGNKARRKQLSTRNLVKDAEKRKLKVEVAGSSSVWG